MGLQPENEATVFGEGGENNLFIEKNNPNCSTYIFQWINFSTFLTNYVSIISPHPDFSIVHYDMEKMTFESIGCDFIRLNGIWLNSIKFDPNSIFIKSNDIKFYQNISNLIKFDQF